MLKRITWIAVCCSFAGVVIADDTKPAAKHEEVHQFFQSFGNAIHKGDAKEVAGHFVDNGLHVRKGSGQPTEGREAIQALYERV